MIGLFYWTGVLLAVTAFVLPHGYAEVSAPTNEPGEDQRRLDDIEEASKQSYSRRAAFAARCNDVYQFNAHLGTVRPSVPASHFLSQVRYPVFKLAGTNLIDAKITHVLTTISARL